MSDLVERLRKRKAFGLNGTWIMLNAPDSDCQEAADRIEALEKLYRLRTEDVMDLGSQVEQAEVRIKALEATLQAIRSALYEPEEANAYDNLEGAAINLEHCRDRDMPVDEACIHTIHRVLAQLAAVHKAYIALDKEIGE